MNRRRFLAQAAATATAAHVLTTSGAESASARRVRIGFLGIAHSHGPAKLKLVQQGADWELVGLTAENPALAAKFPDVTPLSAEKLFEAAEVIAVESAPAEHFAHARAALHAGKHLHLEKPPAATVAELRELLTLAEQRRRLVQMGYMWRYHPGFAKIFEAVRNGWLGDVSLVRATMNSLYASEAQRQELAKFPGGGMMELGCHLIDQLVRLLGAPEKVSTTHATHGGRDGLKDNSVAVFEFPRALGIVHINLLQVGAGAGRTFEVIGSNGTATLRPIEAPVLEFDFAKAAGPYAKGRQVVPLPMYQRYVPELVDLADAVRRGRALGVTSGEELLVQEWLVRACS
jgi:predicted dehydrogenase